MKYEPVFGDKYLADKFTNERSVFIVDRGGVYFEFEDGSAGVNYIANFCAIGDRYYMRRIIAEPKRWTVADQKAGRLPEVGCNVFELTTKSEMEYLGVNANGILNLRSHENYGFVFGCYRENIAPIETPEEKAARLREEWCAKAAKTLKNLEYNSTLTSIYDALLSGDLPVPVKDGE